MAHNISSPPATTIAPVLPGAPAENISAPRQQDEAGTKRSPPLVAPGSDSRSFHAKRRRNENNVDGSADLAKVLKKALNRKDEPAALEELRASLPGIFAKYSRFEITPNYLPKEIQDILYGAMKPLPPNCRKLTFRMSIEETSPDLVSPQFTDAALDLCDCYSNKDHCLAISQVDKNEHNDLEIFLDYSHCELKGTQLEKIADGLKGHSKIVSFDISNQEEDIDSRGIRAIEKFVATGRESKLREINLEDNRLKGEVGEELVVLLKYPGVNVRLGRNELGGRTVLALIKTISEPDSQGTGTHSGTNELGDENGELLAKTLEKYNVDTVNIDGSEGMTVSQVLYFAKAIRHGNTGLKRLGIYGIEINDKNFVILMASIVDPKARLESAVLGHIGLSNFQMDWLIRAITLPKCPLKDISLNRGAVSDWKAKQFLGVIDSPASSIESYLLRGFGSNGGDVIKNLDDPE